MSGWQFRLSNCQRLNPVGSFVGWMSHAFARFSLYQIGQNPSLIGL